MKELWPCVRPRGGSNRFGSLAEVLAYQTTCRIAG
jgi:hypothetical protein